LALVSHIFATAEKLGLKEKGSNPCRGLKRYQEIRRCRFLNPDELNRLEQALGDAGKARGRDCRRAGARLQKEDWRVVACIRLLISTGARLSEILTLQWQLISWDDGTARIPSSSGEPRILRLPEPALELLRRLHRTRSKSNKHVIPGPREDSFFTGIQKPWRRIRAAAGLHNVRIDDLRRCYLPNHLSPPLTNQSPITASLDP
jgi:integrase